jgi:exopolysaccharide production protein ExoQ
MNPSLAALICAAGIIGLLYLDRERNVRVAKALWLPVAYLWILGSRPVSEWLGVPPPTGSNVQLDGSPLDRIVYEVLLAAALIVLIRRRKRTIPILTANWLLLIYFSYCLISVSWAYFPDVAFKRWIKATSDLAMVLVVLTDRQPVEAIRRLVSRLGLIVLPTSVLLIKYYSNLGRVYTIDGDQTNTGVTTNKNSLGLIVLMISLGILWNTLSLLRRKEQSNWSRHLVVQVTLLAFGLALLNMAGSATCIACFVLGGGLMVLTNLRSIRNRPARVHALCATIVLAGAVTFLSGGDALIVRALGRKLDFTGRTDIWAAVIPAVPNPIVGAGFESFWIGPDVAKMQRSLATLGWWHPEGLNEAHNGYIEMYLNLGWIGVCLITLILISGYRRSGRAFQRSPELGSLALAAIATAAIYNLTEAGFRELTPSWIFLLLGILATSGISGGLLEIRTPQMSASSRATANRKNSISCSSENGCRDGLGVMPNDFATQNRSGVGSGGRSRIR